MLRNCGCTLINDEYMAVRCRIYFLHARELGEYLKQFPFERYVFLSKKEDRERTVTIYDQDGIQK